MATVSRGEITITNVDDGKPSNTHTAYSWSADGTDRFTTTYPGENLALGTQFLNVTDWGMTWATTNGKREVTVDGIKVTALQTSQTGVGQSISYEPKTGDVLTLSFKYRGSGSIEPYLLMKTGANLVIGNKYTNDEVEWQTYKQTFTFPSSYTSGVSSLSVLTRNLNAWIELKKDSIKLEKSTVATPYTPAPSEDFANAYPTYVGTYTDYEPTDSEDPSKYTWQRILGESGQDGKDGEDGANGQDAKEVISGYLSNDSIIVPATAAGSVTDFSKAVGDFVVYEGQTKLSSGVTYSKVSETGMTSTINSAGRYTVTALSADVGTATYQAVYKSVTIQKIMIVVKNKQGATGPAGTNGTDGKGIMSSATTYQAGTSGTTPPTGTWSTSIPSVSENQYLWTKIVLTYSDNTNSTAYSVGKMGAKGETGATGSTGATGATGNGIKSTTINFASSTSGTVAPSSGWSTTIPTVSDGNFLWTRTVLTFTDNTTNTSYTVAKQGEKGDPTGIISQSTVPTDPYVGMLWQNTGASGYIIGATYQWNGSKFNLYIFTADNIVATTLSAITANLGNITAGNISGVTISGSKFINEFSYQPYPNNSSIFVFGTTTIENGRWNTEYRQEGNKGIGIVDHTGTAILDPTGVQFSQTMVASNGENSFAKFNALELTMNYGGRGGTLTYNDLYSLPKTGIPSASGWSQYNTSESSENFPSATRQGRMVQLSGAFKNNAVKAAGTENDVMGTLPLGYRPTADCNFICQGTGSNIYLLTVKSNGQLTFSRYRGDTGASNNYRFDYKECGANSWLNIACTFAAADV